MITLEQSKIIGYLFPNSVWIYKRNVSDLHYPWIQNRNLPSNTRHDGEYYYAPTLEDMLDWLWDNGYMIRRFDEGWCVAYRIDGSIFNGNSEIDTSEWKSWTDAACKSICIIDGIEWK